MKKIEVLVASMHQKDLSLYKEMNIQTDVVFANQADSFSNIETVIDGKNVKMITTPQRGVGKNRNTALLHSSADVCILSDEDVVYVDGYEANIQQAFNSLPDADIIIFNIDTIGETKRRINKRIKRVNIYNFLNYGTVRIAFRRESVLKKNIWFTLLFGGGTVYSAGEDNLFLRESLKKGLKIYTYPLKIADVKQETSTWFKGYNEKFFFDKGALLAAAFPYFKYIFSLYLMYRFKNLTEIKSIQIFRLMLKGMRDFKLSTK